MGAILTNYDMAIVCIALAVLGVLYLTSYSFTEKLVYLVIAGVIGGAVLLTWILGG